LTCLLGVQAGGSAAAAIVLHLVSFVPVTILGLLYMWQDGLTLGGLQRMKSEAQAAEAVTDQG
jgi:hypothetical protein